MPLVENHRRNRVLKIAGEYWLRTLNNVCNKDRRIFAAACSPLQTDFPFSMMPGGITTRQRDMLTTMTHMPCITDATDVLNAQP
jgi:hypothetical protein